MTADDLSTATPAALILSRSEAFCRGDFGFIYDSYHPAANFLRQFDDRAAYLAFGQSSLGVDYHITDCQILDQQEQGDEAQVLFLMEMQLHGAVQRFAELAWLRREGEGWLYQRGQKLSNDELPEAPQNLRIADFARLDPATIF